MPTGNVIRDFIYMDIERVRSYMSQILGGLKTESTSIIETRTSSTGSTEIGLPLTAKLKGDIDVYLLRSNAETMSLHDNIFNDFLRVLTARKGLKLLSGNDSTEWDEKSFNDGTFVLAKGAITITDYRYIKNVIENFPKIANDLERVVRASAQGSLAQSRDAKSTKTQANQLPTKEIAGLVENLFGDLVRLKIFPFPEFNERIFVGSGQRDFFRYRPESLVATYGPVIDADWKVLLQINRNTKATKELVSQTGNQVEDSVDQLVVALSEMNKVTQGIRFPAVAVTPIAIFRENSLA